MSTPRRQPANGRSAVAAVLAALLLAPALASADASWVTVEDLVAAILQTSSYSPQQLDELDLTRNGSVGITDVVCYLNKCHKEIQFDQVSTTVEEGAGTVQIGLSAELPVSCTVNYQVVVETATSGLDYTALSGAVGISGTTTAIAVPVLDDTTVPEQIEMVLLRLLPGSCYGVGRVNETTLYITDNDATWYGTMDSAGGQLGFTMQIVHGSGGYAATLTSDGNGTLPAGSWPATISFTDTAFSASVTVPEDDIPDSVTSFATAFSRSFELEAADGAPPDDHNVEPDRIFGSFEETITGAEAHLNATVTGQLVLTRQVALPSSWEPTLEPSAK